METAVVARTHTPFACVRVILDSPTRSISAGWLQPRNALLRPALWPEMLWLAVHAPAVRLEGGPGCFSGAVRALPMTPTRHLVISIHDVAPPFETDIRAIFSAWIG